MSPTKLTAYWISGVRKSPSPFESRPSLVCRTGSVAVSGKGGIEMSFVALLVVVGHEKTNTKAVLNLDRSRYQKSRTVFKNQRILSDKRPCFHGPFRPVENGRFASLALVFCIRPDAEYFECSLIAERRKKTQPSEHRIFAS
jgi:hypothetical protein